MKCVFLKLTKTVWSLGLVLPTIEKFSKLNKAYYKNNISTKRLLKTIKRLSFQV